MRNIASFLLLYLNFYFSTFSILKVLLFDKILEISN